MAKISFKPGNMLYPLPAVLVSVADKVGNTNIFTVAWAGTICTNPPMVSISVRPSRYSHHMIMETEDYCGVKSGRDENKWEALKLTQIPSQEVGAPGIAQSPVNIECKVERVERLGSHDMFIARVVAVHVEDAYMDEKGGFRLAEAKPIVYSHGEYFDLGESLGNFGYSIRKR